MDLTIIGKARITHASRNHQNSREALYTLAHAKQSAYVCVIHQLHNNRRTQRKSTWTRAASKPSPARVDWAEMDATLSRARSRTYRDVPNGARCVDARRPHRGRVGLAPVERGERRTVLRVRVLGESERGKQNGAEVAHRDRTTSRVPTVPQKHLGQKGLNLRRGTWHGSKHWNDGAGSAVARLAWADPGGGVNGRGLGERHRAP